MKKLINLIALVMLVSVNVLTPFTYAGDEIVENETENIGEVAEISEDDTETSEYEENSPENITDDSGEVEQDLQVEDEQESDPLEYQDDENTSNISVDSTYITESELENESKNQDEEESEESLELEKNQESILMDVVPTNPMDIVIEATSTAANQTIKINKYFANAYTVDRGDGSLTQDLTGDTVHTYSVASGYTITLSTTADRWTFQYVNKPLVPTNGTTVTDVKIVSMPSLADGFGNNATNPGNYFFYNFNSNGKLTSLPEGSFDTSKITTVGNDFFVSFNNKGKLTSLPEGSFDTSKITSVGDYFFDYFNANGQLINLPEGSFNISKITKAGHEFFCGFNSYGALISLPKGSFDTSNITTVQSDFFSSFNYNGALTSLPTGSFNTSKITNGKNTRFFSYFNGYGALTGLPEGSFNISKITTAGVEFFSNFNTNGQLTSLPEGSFNFSGITTVGDYFFYSFNYKGELTSLPEGSFNFSGITTVGNYFFSNFNSYGGLTSLSTGSFDTSKITKVGDYFFSSFNRNGQLTSLPEGSFNTTNITKVGDYFFYGFNRDGRLTSLPEGSFDMSNINTAGSYFFQFFNRFGKIMELPNSFNLALVGVSSTKGYQYAFYSTDYAFNKKVSDLLSGFSAPLSDQNTFSDNQPGRCGVHPNWLSTPYNACKIIYDANGGTGTITGGYNSNATSVVVGAGIKLPSMEGYALSGWYDASGNRVETIIFPDMDGQTLYAQWEECGNGYVVNSTGTSCVLKEYTITYDLGGGYLEDLAGNKYEGNQAITYTYSSTGNKYVADLVWENVKKQDSVFLGWYTASDGGEKVNDITSINIAGETLYAHWNDCESGYTLNNLRTSCVLKEYTITYNLGGGYLEDGSGNKHEGNQAITYTYSSTGNKYIADLVWENVNRENSKFLGWYTSEGGAFDFGTIPPEKDEAFAKYECDLGYAVNEDGVACEKIRVEFDANGGKFKDNAGIYTIFAEILGNDSPFQKVLHSPNLTDEGEYIWWQSGESLCPSCAPFSGSNGSGSIEFYGRSTGYVQIEGAESLNVYIKYGGSSQTNISSNIGPIGIRTGEHVDYEPRNPYHSGAAIRYLSEFPSYNSFGESEFITEGDSITIVQSSGWPNYGWYAVISGTGMVKFVGYVDDAFNDIPYPTRNGYKFLGWYYDNQGIEKEFNSEYVIADRIYKVYAKREKLGSSGGGGWGGSSKKTDEDTHGSAEDSQKNTQDDKNTENVIQNETKGSEESSNTPVDSSDKSSEGQEILSPSDSSFTKEQKDAYTFAKENGITTKDTIQSAQMNGKLTRIAMAKMLSQYAMNVLGQKPANIITPKFNDVSDKQNSDYDDGVTLAYQLGIMGQNMPNNNFRPNDEVTRAEFATALSRMAYGTSDGEYKATSKYYIHHMEKLVKEGIITKDDPNMKELRGYVMIMLMRSAK